jgi:uncharacterized protein (TIGR03066 family)
MRNTLSEDNPMTSRQLVAALALGLCGLAWCGTAGAGDPAPKAAPTDLPGAKGPLWEPRGKGDTKLTGADVGTGRQAVSLMPPKSRSLDVTGKQLEFLVSYAHNSPGKVIGTVIEIYDRNGKVDVTWAKEVGFVQFPKYDGTGALVGGEVTLFWGCEAKAGKFPPGSYQAKIIIDKVERGVLNWEIKGSKDTMPDPVKPPEPVKPLDATKLIVGKWEVTKSDEELPAGGVLEFTGNGNIRSTFKKDGKPTTFEGTYTVEKDVLTFTVKVGDETLSEKVRISNISDTEMTTVDNNGKALQFKKLRDTKPDLVKMPDPVKPADPVKPLDAAKLIVGTWEVKTAAPGSAFVSDYVAFTTDGKVRFVAKETGKDVVVAEGTYTVENDTLTLKFKLDVGVKANAITITKASETELLIKESRGAGELKRVK